MKELPILFSAAMVRAILAGTKTMTRRLVTPQPVRVEHSDALWRWLGPTEYPIEHWLERIHEKSRFKVGRRMWVRETWAAHFMYDDVPPTHAHSTQPGDNTWFAADGDDAPGSCGCPAEGRRGKWRPSIHMPRRHSRIDLVVTAHRVERLHDITEDDARAEGVTRENVGPMLPARARLAAQARAAIYGTSEATVDERVWPVARDDRDLFMLAWTAINGERAPWASNPWVEVVSFERVRP